jgi:hypothetical protein
MSVQSPAHTVTRWSLVGMEAMWSKMFDPPTTSPATTDQIPLVPQGLIRPNPVPGVMLAAGYQNTVTRAFTAQFDLMSTISVPTWDNAKSLTFFVIGDPDNPAASSGTFPGPTLRLPRGVIFQGETQGKGPPPHTLHWHGVEPTPLNDGVGHCSMEIGKYTYQWQPNFMGFYFVHCHRNTMQHFENGLYFAMLFEAPDAYFGSIATQNPDGTVVLRDLNQFPIGGGRDGKRRVQCNLNNPLNGNVRFPQFFNSVGNPANPNLYNNRPLSSPDDQPLGPNDTNVRFATDPHAMTVTFDVESLLVFDDRDSVWSDLAPNARATFPSIGLIPGINDIFNANPGGQNFAAFNDYNADYWFVTGVPVPGPKGGTGTIPPNVVIPAALNSGISGTQVSINAQTGQNILVRCLNAAYNVLRLTFPVDIVIVAWDGRALGVAPYGHNESYLVQAGTPIEISVARRFDALIYETAPLANNSFITAEFIDHTSMSPGDTERVLMTARVPINIGGTVQPSPKFNISGRVRNQLGVALAGYAVKLMPKSLGSDPERATVTDINGNYSFTQVSSGNYEAISVQPGKSFLPASRIFGVNNQNVTVPDLIESLSSFTPGSYTLEDALNSLKSVVGLRTPTQSERFRFDVAPFLNGVPTPDNVLDIRDSLNILRMVTGLPPL